jgi:hypothetical protein
MEATTLPTGSATAQLRALHPEHPALARLRERLDREASSPSASQEITSYDRMHHRHNRH